MSEQPDQNTDADTPAAAGTPAAALEYAIQTEDLWRIYIIGAHQEVPAVRGINLAIESCTFVALKGRSGSGKTTLLNCLGGLDSPNPAGLSVSLGTGGPPVVERTRTFRAKANWGRKWVAATTGLLHLVRGSGIEGRRRHGPGTRWTSVSRDGQSRRPRQARPKGWAIASRRSVAQLVEHRSPKPGVAGSSPATPARNNKAPGLDH